MKPTDPPAGGPRSLRLKPGHRIFLIGVTVIAAGMIGYQATPEGRLAPAQMARKASSNRRIKPDSSTTPFSGCVKRKPKSSVRRSLDQMQRLPLQVIGGTGSAQ